MESHTTPVLSRGAVCIPCVSLHVPCPFVSITAGGIFSWAVSRCQSLELGLILAAVERGGSFPCTGMCSGSLEESRMTSSQLADPM